LKTKKAVVIGASRGLGKRMALVLAEADADVIVFSQSLEPLQKIAEKIKKMGRKSYAVECDVSDISKIENLHKLAIDNFCRRRIYEWRKFIV